MMVLACPWAGSLNICHVMLILDVCLYVVSVQAQLRELQQAAEDLQVKLEEHRRRKHEADRLKEQTLKALEAGHNSKCLESSNLPWFGFKSPELLEFVVGSLLRPPQGSFHFISAQPYIGQIDHSTSGQMVKMTNGRTSGTAGRVKYRCSCHWNKWTRRAERLHIAVPQLSFFTFLKPSEGSCSWLTGKFPYRCKHLLALHLSDVQTCACECTERCGAG